MSPSSQIPEDAILAAEAQVARNCEHRLYVIRFSEGFLKVGRTCDVNVRIRQHIKEARTLDLWVEDLWLSTPHTNILTTETALIAFCKKRWEVAHGLEWFQGANFRSTITFATRLPKNRLTRVGFAARTAQILLGTYSPAAVAAALGFDGDM